MLADAKNGALYGEWLSHIDAEDTRDAFQCLVGRAATLESLTCHPQQKGVVSDFRFMDPSSNEQPFALIPNKRWLLFYFRAPAVRSGRYTFSDLKAAFDSASENARGEWTIKVRSIDDVRRLWSLLEIN